MAEEMFGESHSKEYNQMLFVGRTKSSSRMTKQKIYEINRDNG